MNISKKCCHQNHLQYKLTPKISFCPTCSSLIFLSVGNDEQIIQKKAISIIKPENYSYSKEILSFDSFQGEKNNRNCYSFINKKEFLKYRKPIIKNMKKIISHFNLSIQTYFLSIEYFDYISSFMASFNNETILQISNICIILATKFNENSQKVFEILPFLKNNDSKIFVIDEIYILNLLNYELKKYTVFDLLTDILNFGFVFGDENFNEKKFEWIHGELINILYIFSENNSFINFTPKQIAISIIGLARELLELEPFSERIIEIFNLKGNFNFGLKNIKKFFKINDSPEIEKNQELMDNVKQYNKNIFIRMNKSIIE